MQIKSWFRRYMCLIPLSIRVSSYWGVDDDVGLYVCVRPTMCPHTTICMSSYGTIKDSINAGDTAGGCWRVPRPALCSYMCVPPYEQSSLTLLHVSPYCTTVHLSTMCPYRRAALSATTCVPLLHHYTSVHYVSPHTSSTLCHYICVPLLHHYTCIHYMCPYILHETVSMQYVVCVLYMCPHTTPLCICPILLYNGPL